MEFEKFSKVLDKIERTASRNEMTEILAALIKEVTAKESRESIYLLQGRVEPVYHPLEFNFAEKMMVKALSLTFGIDRRVIRDKFEQLGDLGNVAEELRKGSSAIKKQLTIEDVYSQLHAIASYTGTGSQDKKVLAIKSLLLDSDPVSCRFITRIPIGKMRLGLSARTVLDVLSWVEAGDKSLRSQFERAYYSCSDLGYLLEVYKEGGVAGIEKINITPGVPLFSKLVERIPTTEKIIEKMGPVWVQPKFDGLRCQVHMWTEHGEKKVQLFSRNLEVLTDMFPDVVEAIKEINADSLIIDSEVIGFNEETGEFMPFQKTMYRKRKHGVEKTVAEIPVELFAFDILYYDGKSLLNKEIEYRMDILKKILPTEGLLEITETKFFEDPGKLEEYFLEQVNLGLEGIIAKRAHSIYEPGTRNFEWIKLKRAMKGHLSDTVDVVIMGYYAGKGRLSKFGMGAFLAGVLDKDSDKYVTVAKVGTGMTDQMWRELSRKLKDLVVDEKPAQYSVDSILKPDYWVSPQVVSQIRADEITRSPVHTCAMNEDGVGYALRFPRIEILFRDKLADDCTTVKEVLGLYQNQLSPK